MTVYALVDDSNHRVGFVGTATFTTVSGFAWVDAGSATVAVGYIYTGSAFVAPSTSTTTALAGSTVDTLIYILAEYSLGSSTTATLQSALDNAIPYLQIIP